MKTTATQREKLREICAGSCESWRGAVVDVLDDLLDVAEERDALRAEVDALHAELDRQARRVISARQDVVNELAAEAGNALDNASEVMRFEAVEGRARELSAMTLRNLVAGMTLGDTVENNLRAELAVAEDALADRVQDTVVLTAEVEGLKTQLDHSVPHEAWDRALADMQHHMDESAERLQMISDGARREEELIAEVARLRGAIEEHRERATNPADPEQCSMCLIDEELWRVLSEVKP